MSGDTGQESISTSTDMSSSAALKAAKKALRTQMKSRLSDIQKTSLDTQSGKLLQALEKFPAYQESKRISIYLSMPSGEIQTDVIVRSALASGKKVFVPYMYPNPKPSDEEPKKLMDMVSLHDLNDYTSLKPDSWGIPTLPEESISSREWILEGKDNGEGLDLVLLPGVAFELVGNGTKRLGHGKGFYDYFLERHGKQFGNKVALYGLGLKEQLVGEDINVPTGPLDKLLDGIFVDGCCR